MNHPLPQPHMLCPVGWLQIRLVGSHSSECDCFSMQHASSMALDKYMVIIHVFSTILLPIYQKILRNKHCAVWHILFKRCSYQPVFVQTHTDQCLTGPQQNMSHIKNDILEIQCEDMYKYLIQVLQESVPSCDVTDCRVPQSNNTYCSVEKIPTFLGRPHAVD